MDISFKIPQGMTNEQLAQTFAAYLLGFRAFGDQDGRCGPRRKRPDSDAGWQLDWFNDYCLHVAGRKATITCRYRRQMPVIKAAVAMLKVITTRH